jgi:O-antigen/teichoic acid export membrane protein
MPWEPTALIGKPSAVSIEAWRSETSFGDAPDGSSVSRAKRVTFLVRHRERLRSALRQAVAAVDVSGLYLIGSMLQAPVGAAVMLITARYVTPEELGWWNGWLLTVSYIAFMGLGVPIGLNRNLAFYVGAGNSDRAERSAGASLWISRLSGVTGAVLIAAVVVGLNWSSMLERPARAAAVALLAVVVFSTQLRGHYDATFKSSGEFARLGRILVADGVIAIAALPLVVRFGDIGMWLQYTIARAGSCALRGFASPIKARDDWDYEVLSELILVGLPIMAAGYAFTLFQLSDRTFVAVTMGAADLGHYSVAHYTYIAMTTVPTVMSTFYYSRAAHDYGSFGAVDRLWPLARKAVVSSLLLVVPIAAVMWIWGGEMLTRIAPRYAGAADVLKPMAIAATAASLWNLTLVFPVVGRMKEYNALIALMLSLSWATYGMLWAFGGALSLSDVAWLKCLLLLVFGLLAGARVWALTRPTQSTLRKELA